MGQTAQNEKDFNLAERVYHLKNVTRVTFLPTFTNH